MFSQTHKHLQSYIWSENLVGDLRYCQRGNSESHYSIRTICNLRLTATQPFTEHFPNANVYELISPDLLHQLVKGVFKDHLVEWVCEYLEGEHGKSKADSILDKIDRR